MAIAAVGQLTSTSSMLHNLAQCRTLVAKAVAAGAKALFLPEATDYIASSAAESISLAEPLGSSPFVKALQEEARKASLAINVGIHEPADSGKRVKNSSIWIDEQGEIAQKYQKLHLFDIDIKDGPRLKESDSVQPGSAITAPFSSALGKIGLAICYDLRFPEISISLRHQGAEIITFPSAFTVPTGKAHWKILLQSRAIETQCFVIAAAQVGEHNTKRKSYGHSMIVSPWGDVLAELGDNDDDEPEIAIANIDLDLLAKGHISSELNQQDGFPVPTSSIDLGSVGGAVDDKPYSQFVRESPTEIVRK